MEEPVTDGDDHARHRQLVVVDVVTPISHNISSSSSITPSSPISAFSPSEDSAIQKVTGSDVSRSNKVSPTNMLDTSKFTLPENWYVTKVPRKSGGPSDKYYHDPETGIQFRSLKEVERYITEGVKPQKSKTKTKRLNYRHDKKNSGSKDIVVARGKNSGSRDRVVARGKMSDSEEDHNDQYQLAIVSPTSASPTTPFNLPDGWVVKEVPRRFGDHATDKYYFEPGSGKMFRSMVAVKKHLSELKEENSPLSIVLEELRENKLPISKAFKLSSSIKNHGSYDSWKKSISRKEKTSKFDNQSPPSKIHWVIAGSKGDAWNAFLDDTLVPDSVKQQWGKTFTMAINNAPVSG